MGHDATVTKKRVLGKVEDCVAAVNDVIAACTEMTEKHDALCVDLNARHDTIQSRFTAQGEWLVTHDGQLSTLERDVATLHADTVTAWKSHDALDRASTRAFKVLANDLRDLRTVLTEARAEADSFASLGLLDRLRWLFTGRWDRPLRRGEGIEAGALDAPITESYGGIERAGIQRAQVVETQAGAFPS
jgi:hypothetical protein